ncbi:MAG TPA: protease pro-enzyme activation domain-containing protein, partial [Acidimicrobiales bacterium]|nr:protease pro-enzyme activation domain-containing protein [Acidimicrobiales bacterium]
MVVRRHSAVSALCIALAASTATFGAAWASGRPQTSSYHRLAPITTVRDRALAVAAVPSAAKYLGAAPASTALGFDVVLAPSDSAAVAQAAASVSTPGSPDYHRFFTSAQFDAKFAPSSTLFQQVESWLEGEGLKVAEVSPFVISVSGSVGQAANALGVKFGRYSLPNGVSGLVATGSPVLPAGLASGAVTGIVGLDTLDRPRDFLAKPLAAARGGQAGAPAPASAPTASTGLPSACTAASSAASAQDSYTPDQLGTYYQINGLENAGQNGAGVTIALPEINASSSTDISTFEQCFGLSNPVSVVNVDGGPPSGSLSEGEADIDIEMAATLAPGASIVAYETSPTNADLID